MGIQNKDEQDGQFCFLEKFSPSTNLSRNLDFEVEVRGKTKQNKNQARKESITESEGSFHAETKPLLTMQPLDLLPGRY